MSKRYALSVCAALAIVFALPARAAQTYVNAQYGYIVKFPDGWTIAIEKDDPGGVFAQAPDQAGRANCGMTAMDEPTTVQATQEQLNTEMRTPFGREFWRTTVFADREKLEFESDGARMHPSGLAAQEAIVSSESKTPGGVRVKAISLLMLSPGVSYALVCAVREDGFETARPMLKQIVDSFRTKNNPGAPTVDANPAPMPTVMPAAARPAIPQGASNALLKLSKSVADRAAK